jgi:hypothetical protein
MWVHAGWVWVVLAGLVAAPARGLESASPYPVGTTGNGTCGPTNYGNDCDTQPKGVETFSLPIQNCSAITARKSQTVVN